MDSQKDFYRLAVLGMLFLILFCFPIPVNSLSVLFTEIKEQIPLTTADAGRIMSMVSLAAFLFFAIGGALADKIGPRLALGGVSLLGAVAGGMRAFADSANDLMAYMFLMGGAVALFYPLIPKVIGSWFAPHDFGKANGAASFVLYFSSALGVATAANYLSPAFGGWRGFFIVWGIVTAIATIPWLLFYREGPHLASNPGPSPSFRENYRKVLKNKEILLLAVFMAVNMMGIMTVWGLLPLTLQERGISRAGEFVFLMNGTGMIFNVVGGYLSDKAGRRKPFLILSCVIQGVLAPSLAILNGIPLALNLILFGAAVGIFNPVLMSMPLEMKRVGPALVGTAMGFIFTVGSLGGFLGPFLLGKVMDVKGVMVAFVIIGALLLLSAAFVLPIQETGKKKAEREQESLEGET